MNTPAAVALVLALAIPAIVPAAPPARGRARLAVMEIRALDASPAQAELLSEVALTEAAASRRFEVIGRSDIAAIIGLEKQKTMLGCVDDSPCLAEIGGALGVPYLIVGTFGRLGTTFRIDLKLIDTRRSNVLERFGRSVQGRVEELAATVQAGIRELLAAIPEPPGAGAPALGQAPLPKAQPGGVAPRSPASPPIAGAEASSPRSRWAAWVSGGLGVAALAAGGVVGLQARQRLDDQRKAGAAGDADAWQRYRKDVRSLSLTADALFVAGVTGVGAGLWLGLAGRSAAVTASAAPLSGGVAAVVQGSF